MRPTGCSSDSISPGSHGRICPRRRQISERRIRREEAKNRTSPAPTVRRKSRERDGQAVNMRSSSSAPSRCWAVEPDCGTRRTARRAAITRRSKRGNKTVTFGARAVDVRDARKRSALMSRHPTNPSRNSHRRGFRWHPQHIVRIAAIGFRATGAPSLIAKAASTAGSETPQARAAC